MRILSLDSIFKNITLKYIVTALMSMSIFKKIDKIVRFLFIDYNIEDERK